MPMMKITKIIQEGPRVRTFRFVPKRPIAFQAGQFMMLGADLKTGGKSQYVKRAYSISSSPCQALYIEITVSLKPDGIFTPYLFSLKEGDQIDVSGPFGTFALDEKLKKVTLIAGGTGITPFHSMLGCVTDKMLKMDIALFYSARHVNEIVFMEAIREMAENHRNVRCIFTITRGEGNELRDWKGETGRIDGNMIKKYTPDFRQRHYYIVGPPEMVSNMEETLKSMGVPEKGLQIERW